MHASNIILALAASSMASAGIVHLAERVAMPFGAINARAASNGWSLQSTSAVSGLTSCGSNAYCPSGTTCNAKASAEVAACCTSGDCRGDIEGAPKCADSAWSLWKGYNGNGFCCLVGEVGVYDSSSNTAGSCVSSAGSGVTEAVLMSTGTGSGAAAATTTSTTSVASSTTVSSSVTTTMTSASAVSTSTGSSTTSVVSGTSTASSVASVATSIVAVTSASSNGTATSGTSTATSTTASAAATKTGAAGKVSVGFAGVVGAVVLGFAL